MNTELELLVSRLRWPISSTRWWAMQELSQLLLSPALEAATAIRLREELYRCRLEAEAVEVLFIFWMAYKQGYGLPPELPDSLGRPSLLANMLLSDMGLPQVQALNPPLLVAPEDFDVPSKFLEVQGTLVARIYYSRLIGLESYSNLPFVHQCAFEWATNQAAYPDAPFQGDLAYFVRPIGEDVTGAFACRSTLRVLSAYQRTLAVAQEYWRAPVELMQDYVQQALPLDPTLAFLRSVRPSWLPSLEPQIGADALSVEAFLRQSVQALEEELRGCVLLALSTPIHVSRDEVVELEAVRWQQWSPVDINAAELMERFQTLIEEGKLGECKSVGLSVRTYIPTPSLSTVKDKVVNAAPMAIIFGVGRLGYLQRDLYPARLYYPVVTGNCDELIVEPKDGELSFVSNQCQVATLQHWNAGWGPVRPTAMSAGLCGMSLVSTSDLSRNEGKPRTERYFYLWRLKRLKRPQSYDQFHVEELTGVFSP